MAGQTIPGEELCAAKGGWPHPALFTLPGGPQLPGGLPRALPRSLQTVSQAPSGPRPDVLKLASWERLLGALRTMRTASTLGPKWPGRNLCRSLPVVGPSQWGTLQDSGEVGQ